MLYTNSDKQRVMAEGGESPARSAFRRDYGRLLHSPAFRRLQGKTQLFPGHESDFFRNRLTHSLEVAQVAKGIALQLNATKRPYKTHQIDTDLVELAALAHDLGHPPFGHNGEKALDDCMKEFGGFEGNAQTLRLLARIEKKRFDVGGDYCGVSTDGRDLRLGLNLTYRSLAAVLKYDNMIPLERAQDAPLAKGYYASEAPLVQAIKEKVGAPSKRDAPFKTIECQIMDLADDIAYSTYDLEDSMKGGFSHPLQLRARLGSDPDLVERVFTKVKKEVDDVTQEEVFQSLQALFDLGSGENSDVDGDDPNYVALLAFSQSINLASQGNLRAGFTSTLVDRFVNGIRIKGLDQPKFSKLYLERSIQVQIEALKHLNYELMIMSPRLKVVEFRGYDLVKTIFVALDSQDGHLLLPEDCRLMHSRLRTAPERKRLICDFVAGMTDRYAMEFYGRLKESGASIFKPI